MGSFGTIALKEVLRMLDQCAPDLTIQGDGQETRAFCEVRDFTRGLMNVIDKGVDQNVYHLGSDEEVTIQHLAEAIGRELGRNVRVVPSAGRAGSTPRRCPDLSKVRELGYVPRLALREGLRDTIAWYARWADNTETNGS